MAAIAKRDRIAAELESRTMRSRIMYIENKSGGLVGPCRIGRVRFSKTGATIYYGGRSFQRLKGAGFKANYFDLETGHDFWISGPRRDGADGLYGRITQPGDVDADVADEYWRDIRGIAGLVRDARSEEARAEFEVDAPEPSALFEGLGRRRSRLAMMYERAGAQYPSSERE